LQISKEDERERQMSKKEGMAWIPILNLILGLLALVGCILPWFTFLIISFSAFDLATVYALLYIVPVGAIIAVIFGILTFASKGKAKIFGWLILIGGLLVFIGALYYGLQVSFLAVGIGFMLDLVAGILLVLFGLLQGLGK
jgi:hypothetical protein